MTLFMIWKYNKIHTNINNFMIKIVMLLQNCIIKSIYGDC